MAHPMRFAVLLLSLLASACATAPQQPAAFGPAPVDLSAGETYAATEPDRILLFSAADAPKAYTAIAKVRVASGDAARTSLYNFRFYAAKRGATGIAMIPTAEGGIEYVAFFHQPAPGTLVDATPENVSAPKSTRASSGGCVGSCTVNVRGYTRKDGTYVRPHTRNRPGTKSSSGRRKP